MKTEVWYVWRFYDPPTPYDHKRGVLLATHALWIPDLVTQDNAVDRARFASIEEAQDALRGLIREGRVTPAGAHRWVLCRETTVPLEFGTNPGTTLDDNWAYGEPCPLCGSKDIRDVAGDAECRVCGCVYALCYECRRGIPQKSLLPDVNTYHAKTCSLYRPRSK